MIGSASARELAGRTGRDGWAPLVRVVIATARKPETIEAAFGLPCLADACNREVPIMAPLFANHGHVTSSPGGKASVNGRRQTSRKHG